MTNFVEDIRAFPLIKREEGDTGGFNRRFQLAEGAMIMHVSLSPVGIYKKAIS